MKTITIRRSQLVTYEEIGYFDIDKKLLEDFVEYFNKHAVGGITMDLELAYNLTRHYLNSYKFPSFNENEEAAFGMSDEEFRQLGELKVDWKYFRDDTEVHSFTIVSIFSAYLDDCFNDMDYDMEWFDAESPDYEIYGFTSEEDETMSLAEVKADLELKDSSK